MFSDFGAKKTYDKFIKMQKDFEMLTSSLPSGLNISVLDSYQQENSQHKEYVWKLTKSIETFSKNIATFFFDMVMQSERDHVNKDASHVTDMNERLYHNVSPRYLHHYRGIFQLLLTMIEKMEQAFPFLQKALSFMRERIKGVDHPANKVFEVLIEMLHQQRLVLGSFIDRSKSLKTAAARYAKEEAKAKQSVAQHPGDSFEIAYTANQSLAAFIRKQPAELTEQDYTNLFPFIYHAWNEIKQIQGQIEKDKTLREKYYEELLEFKSFANKFGNFYFYINNTERLLRYFGEPLDQMICEICHLLRDCGAYLDKFEEDSADYFADQFATFAIAFFSLKPPVFMIVDTGKYIGKIDKNATSNTILRTFPGVILAVTSHVVSLFNQLLPEGAGLENKMSFDARFVDNIDQKIKGVELELIASYYDAIYSLVELIAKNKDLIDKGLLLFEDSARTEAGVRFAFCLTLLNKLKLFADKVMPKLNLLLSKVDASMQASEARSTALLDELKTSSIPINKKVFAKAENKLMQFMQVKQKVAVNQFNSIFKLVYFINKHLKGVLLIKLSVAITQREVLDERRNKIESALETSSFFEKIYINSNANLHQLSLHFGRQWQSLLSDTAAVRQTLVDLQQEIQRELAKRDLLGEPDLSEASKVGHVKKPKRKKRSKKERKERKEAREKQEESQRQKQKDKQRQELQRQEQEKERREKQENEEKQKQALKEAAQKPWSRSGATSAHLFSQKRAGHSAESDVVQHPKIAGANR